MCPTCRFLLVDLFFDIYLIKAGRGQLILETGDKLTVYLIGLDVGSLMEG